MGLADRDYYREHRRSAERPSRWSIVRIALVWLVVGCLVYAGARWLPELLRPERTAPAQAARPAPPVNVSPAPRTFPRVEPLQPSLSGRPPEPGRPQIYRCGNAYSATPCPGGRAIEDRDSAGIDTRPSPAMARLVEEGRTSVSATTVESTTTTNASNACATLDAAIAAIDATARQSSSAEQQNKLRDSRRRFRDQQIRLRCRR